MTKQSQQICLWSGYMFFPLYLAGIVLLARFIPPPSPALDGDAIKLIFDSGRTSILAGMAFCSVSSALFIPWSVAISAQLSRLETGFPVFAWVQALAGAIGALFFALSPFVWATMAYRATHSADLMLALNDFAWISWIISWPFFVLQEFAVGLAVLLLSRQQQLFPRWLAYVAIAGSLTMVPTLMLLFFKTGPFAWNGIFGLYIPLAIYAVWYHLITYTIHKAIDKP